MQGFFMRESFVFQICTLFFDFKSVAIANRSNSTIINLNNIYIFVTHKTK